MALATATHEAIYLCLKQHVSGSYLQTCKVARTAAWPRTYFNVFRASEIFSLVAYLYHFSVSFGYFRPDRMYRPIVPSRLKSIMLIII